MNELDILRDRLVTERNEATKSMLAESNNSIHHYLSGLDRGLCLALRFIAEIKADREKTQETY